MGNEVELVEGQRGGYRVLYIIAKRGKVLLSGRP
jgi:hypothetical protein